MTNKTTGTILLFFIMFISCNNIKTYPDSTLFSIKSFPESQKLKSEIWENDSLYRPLNICCFDSVIITSDTGTECFIQCYNKITGEKLTESLEWGNGPDDMTYISSFQKAQDTLFVFNSLQNKYMLFSISELIAKSKTSSLASVTINEEAVINALYYPPSLLIANTLDSGDNLFSIYNEKGDFVVNKGLFPDDGNVYSSFFEKSMAFEYELAINPTSKEIVICYKLTDLIEIYDINFQLKKRIQGPDLFFPVTNEINEDGSVSSGPITGKTREAYGRPVVTEDEIWVLYSGDIMGEKANGYLKDKLFVFDWDGTPLRYYQLDISVFRFDIDFQEKTIFAITDVPDFHIVKFSFF